MGMLLYFSTHAVVRGWSRPLELNSGNHRKDNSRNQLKKKERRVPALPLRFSKRTTPSLLLRLRELGSPQGHSGRGAREDKIHRIL